MRRCTFNSLREKEVINICNGKSLGYIVDLEIEMPAGRIISIIVPGEGGFLCFGKRPPMIIDCSRIQKVGEDTILVDLSCPEPCPPKGNC